jgi:titin
MLTSAFRRLFRRSPRSAALKPFRPAVEILEDRRLLAQVYVVTTTLDHVAGGPVVQGSLRDAITQANQHRAALQQAGMDDGIPDTILFNIKPGGPQRLGFGDPLPAITDYVIIDGTSQPGYAGQPIIELAGDGLGPNSNGLTITVGNCTVKGLVVNDFPGAGIFLNASGNTIVGNWIGTDNTGKLARPNGTGVAVAIGANNAIGGVAPAARNVISGNTTGVAVTTGGNNTVQNNFIGTDFTGGQPLGNGTGVLINGASLSTTVTGNVIASNRQDGIEIEGPGTGANSVLANAVLGNNVGVEVHNGAPGNLIVGNNVNFNNTDGVLIHHNTAATAVLDNTILGNRLEGVVVADNPPPEDLLDWLDDVTGDLVADLQPFATHIGLPGHGNLISGNGGDGVAVVDPQTALILVQANRIGTNAAGTQPLANGGDGVVVTAPNANFVGGAAVGEGNLISGNAGNGVTLVGDTLGVVGDCVEGNLVGTDAQGAAAVPNRGAGMAILSAYNFIGGTFLGGGPAGSANVVSGNLGDGILLTGQASFGNKVNGNFIGTDAAGAVALGNGGSGVHVSNGASNNVIGGTVNGQPTALANTIANNGGDGVLLDGGNGTEVSGNAIFFNGNLGIELRNGANTGQPAPVLTGLQLGVNQVTVQGTLRSGAAGIYAVEVFASPPGDPSGVCEGKTLLGTVYVMAGANALTPFQAVFNTVVPGGQCVTATATDPKFNTSPFSNGLVVAVPLPRVVGPILYYVNSPAEGTTAAAGQKSMIRHIQVTFDRFVTFDPGAFVVTKVNGPGTSGNVGVVSVSASRLDPVTGKFVVTLSFSGAHVEGGAGAVIAIGGAIAGGSGSLEDGNYTFTIVASKVHGGGPGGPTLDGNGNGVAEGSPRDDVVEHFFRLFGDSNGDGAVNDTDLAAFRQSSRLTLVSAGYQAYFDYDGNGVIDLQDAYQFQRRYHLRLNPDGTLTAS